MFGKRFMFKSFVAIAVAASMGFAGAANATTQPYNPNPYAYVHGGASQLVSKAIQSKSIESLRFATAARNFRAARVHGLITDTLGGNG